jgi:NTE family protein
VYRPIAVTSRPTTAFVFGGGGMLGAAEVGMVRALLERGVSPDLIVGSSVGALNGALVAADPSSATAARMVDIWTGLSDRGVFGGSLIGQLGTLVRHGTFLHSNERLRTLLDDALGAATDFGDLRVRFECIAACIERAAPQWFSTGPVVPAVLASCAVPGLLPAVEVGGEHFFDGGLVRSVPIGRAVELGAARIFVLHVGRLEHPLTAPNRPWQVAHVAFEIARRHHFEEEMASLPDGVELHVLPTGSSPPGLNIRYRRTSAVAADIADAYDATRAYLEQAGCR